jgi:ribose transport system ATP-binding protein
MLLKRGASLTKDEKTILSDPLFALEMKGISKNFGGIRALEDADFSCERGAVHALIGENGAGKSTLVKILCGLIKSDKGTISVNGEPAKINNPVDAGKYGISAVFQELSSVPDLSVAENIFLGREPAGRSSLINFKNMNEMAKNLLEDLGIALDPRIMAGDLSLADKQLVEIAKAMSKKPDIIVFDEATSALGQEEVELLFELIRRLTKRDGKAAIFISHKMNELEAIADYATVFRDSRNVSAFKMGSVSNEQITRWIIGRDLDKTFPARTSPLSGECVLRMRNISVHNKLSNVSVDIKKGEILGLAGLQGHGQGEFLKVLFGSLQLDGGLIELKGVPIKIKNPGEAIKNGIALIPEDRKTEGLHITLSVKENLSIMILNKISKAGWLSSSMEKAINQEAVGSLSIKISDTEQLAVSLSGGNQQKVVIGKVLATKSDILLMGDPTRGIDIGTKAEIYHLIRSLSENGNTILLYSTEINELIGLCDRVIVLKKGQIVAELSGINITKTSIINASLGIGGSETA